MADALAVAATMDPGTAVEQGRDPALQVWLSNSFDVGSKCGRMCVLTFVSNVLHMFLWWVQRGSSCCRLLSVCQLTTTIAPVLEAGSGALLVFDAAHPMAAAWGRWLACGLSAGSHASIAAPAVQAAGVRRIMLHLVNCVARAPGGVFWSQYSRWCD